MLYFYWGDYKSPVVYRSNLFYGGFQIRRDAWWGTLLEALRYFGAFSPSSAAIIRTYDTPSLNMSLLIELQHIDVEDGEVFSLKLVLLRLEQVILSCS